MSRLQRSGCSRPDIKANVCKRNALTLVELLTVVSILALLTLLSLPLVGPAIRAREAREAARSLSAMISMAQNRAIELRRPVGILIERGEVEPDAGVAVHLCETPTPFTGLSESSLVRVEWLPDTDSRVGAVYGTGLYITEIGSMVSGWASEMPPGAEMLNLVRAGDLIRLSSSSQLYVIERDAARAQAASKLINNKDPAPDNTLLKDPDAAVVWRLDPVTSLQFPSMPSMNDMTPMGGSSMGMAVPFQIYRQPVRSSQRPLQFTPGGVIDLALSGTDGATGFDMFRHGDPNDALANGNRPAVMIMFAPDGSLSVVYSNGQIVPNTGSPIYLLVGKQELVGLSGNNTLTDRKPDEPLYNYQDPNARWIRIEPSTGHVTVAETVPPAVTTYWACYDYGNVPPAAPNPPLASEYSYLGGEVLASRDLARSGESIGGDR